MYRFITIYLLLALSSVFVKAQELVQGTLGSINNIYVATVQFDFSQAKVEEVPLEDFVGLLAFEDGSKFREAFDKDINDILIDFIEEFNDTNCQMLLTVSPNSETVLTIKVKKISRKGNSVSCDYIITNKPDSKPIVIISMTSKDGRVGSFTNLMGDAFEKAGKDLGKYLKKQLKDANKKQKNK